MLGRLRCATCGAGLVPALSGLKCPRMSACGRPGLEETAWVLRYPIMATASVGVAEA